jgi:hypothetical protein
VISVAFDAAGTAWVAFLANGEAGVTKVHVARFDGRAWTPGPTDGLPGDTYADSYAAWVTTTGDDVYVVASSGLYRLQEARWIRVWPTAVEPGAVRSLLAVSRDEAWAGTSTGVFHYLDGSWVYDQPAGLTGAASGLEFAAGPNGRLWAGGYFGLVVRDGDRWTNVPGVENPSPLAVGPDGTLWVVGSHAPADQLEVFSVPSGGRRISPDPIEPSPLGWISALAVGRDGTLWAGSNDFLGFGQAGLARFDGRRWERVRPRGAVDTPVTAIAAAPNGDIWVRFSEWSAGSVARFDGTSWTEYGPDDGLVGLGQTLIAGMAVGPDGTVWVTTLTGLARFDGQRWTVRDEAMEFDQVSVAADGTVWAIGTGGILRIVTAGEP